MTTLNERMLVLHILESQMAQLADTLKAEGGEASAAHAPAASAAASR
ncbi:MAG TPA: hypothetical protein VIP05_00045 [Burkholderiaceae bacterium]